MQQSVFIHRFILYAIAAFFLLTVTGCTPQVAQQNAQGGAAPMVQPPVIHAPSANSTTPPPSQNSLNIQKSLTAKGEESKIESSPIFHIKKMYEKDGKRFVDAEQYANIYGGPGNQAAKAAIEDDMCHEPIVYDNGGYVFDDCGYSELGIYIRKLAQPVPFTFELDPKAELRLPVRYGDDFNGMEFVDFAKFAAAFSEQSLKEFDWTAVPFHFAIVNSKVTEIYKLFVY